MVALNKVLMLLIACLLLLTGCKEDNGVNQEQKIIEEKRAVLEEKIQVDTLQVEQGETGVVLVAQVTLPDYSAVFRECNETLNQNASTVADFERLLYETAAKKITARDSVAYDITLELPEKDTEQWEPEELRALAVEEAMEKEINEYCLDYLLEHVALEVEEE